MTVETERSAVKSADRVLDVLELVARDRRGLSHTQISVELKIPKSSLTHLLRNLSDRAFLQFDSTSRRFSLGAAAIALGGRAQESAFNAIAAEYLAELTRETRESSGAYVFDGLDVDRIAGRNCEQALLYSMSVPHKFPAYAISGGKAMLAFLPDEELDAYFAAVKPLAITSTTLSEKSFRDQLPRIRETGFADCIEECTLGIVGIGTPILSAAGYPLGSIAVCLPRMRYDQAVGDAIREGLARSRGKMEAHLKG